MTSSNLKPLHVYIGWIFLLLSIGCQPSQSASTVVDEKQEIVKRAEGFFQTCVNKEVEALMSFIILDEPTKQRLGIVEDDTEEMKKVKVEKWFSTAYFQWGFRKIGDVYIHHSNDFARVTYWGNDDLDAIDMKRIDGVWYFTFENRP